LFFAEAHYGLEFEWLAEYAGKTGCLVPAYVLMRWLRLWRSPSPGTARPAVKSAATGFRRVAATIVVVCHSFAVNGSS
jgi:hypothetical protein